MADEAGNKPTTDFDTALVDFVQNNVTLDVPALLDEFLEIKCQTQTVAADKKATYTKNKEKNRSTGVYCLDATRVHLRWPEAMPDYIHANWVDTPEQKKRFICTQAPKKSTVDDFWRMIWQEKCPTIVMLCGLFEKGKPKSEKYWPQNPGDTMRSGLLTIKCVSVTEVEPRIQRSRLEVRLTILQYDGNPKPHVVEHNLWGCWPDRGVPADPLICIRFLTGLSPGRPIVVHCSAGVGRTGTLVATDIILSDLNKGETPVLDTVVRELREARHGSVQMDTQYLYLARSFMALADSRKLIPNDQLTEWVAAYEKHCATQAHNWEPATVEN
ncbi:unnamed protein product, partial [Mesorhabditis spiculigera]